jgi:hypothetical protein
MTEQEAPPEAALIEKLREELPDKESKIARVAKKAGISESRWRQIAKGYQQVDKGTQLRVVAPPGTLARMARAVGATPEALEQAGRSDAAQELSKLPSAASVSMLDDLSDDDLVKELAKRLADRHEGHNGSVRNDGAWDESKDGRVPGALGTMVGIPAPDDAGMVWHEESNERDHGRGG